LRNINSLLFDLRVKDEDAANALYLRILKFTAARPTVDGETLMKLGVYVFNSPALAHSENGYEVTAIGEQSVINLSADRPDIPIEVTRAYLNATITIITRPTADPVQRQLFYIAGHQILPRVQALLPSRTQELVEWMESLSSSMPRMLTQQSTYESLSAKSYQLKVDVSLAAIDKTTDDSARDEMCVGVAHAFTERNNLGDALIIAGRVKNAKVRSELTNLINFRRAVDLLERGNVFGARIVAEALSPSVGRSVLWLGIAQRFIEMADKEAAAEAIDRSLSDAHSTSDPRAPYLLIAASSILTKIDLLSALQTLAESVQSFNQKENGLSPTTTWTEQIKVGNVTRDFSLLIRGIPMNFKEALPQLLAADFNETIVRISMIKDEQLLGQALVSVGTATVRSRLGSLRLKD
jgi:hypothetical protein